MDYEVEGVRSRSWPKKNLDKGCRTRLSEQTSTVFSGL